MAHKLYDPDDDDFGLWYRFRCLVVFNLLYIAGPAQLHGAADPRKALEQDYARRRDLHRAKLGKPPIVDKPSASGGVDPVILCAVAGALALVLLLVWGIASR